MTATRKPYRCQAIKANSRFYTASFYRASDLERHREKHHQTQGITFVHYDPSTGARRRSIFQSVLANLRLSSRRNSLIASGQVDPPLYPNPFARLLGGDSPTPVHVLPSLPGNSKPPPEPGTLGITRDDGHYSPSVVLRTIPTYEVKQSRWAVP